MTFVLALSPILLVLGLMGASRTPAAVAGLLGAILTVVVGLAAFDFATDGGTSDFGAVFGALLEAAHSALGIVWIIFPALALFEFQRRVGAIERIRDGLSALAETPRLQVIFIAWFFGLFVEGAAGFGTPVALAAPLLVGFGFKPVKAVTLALIGHAAGVSFGAIGTPVLTQASITGVSGDEIGLATAALHAAFGVVLLLALMRLADETPLSRRDIGWSALAAACFLLPSLAIAALAGPELPTLGGALIGGAAFALLVRWRRRGGATSGARIQIRDAAPYLLVLATVLITRLVPAVGDALQSVVLEWRMMDVFGGSFEPFYHPGTLLLVSLIASAVITRHAAEIAPALSAAAKRIVLVALALLAMLAMARLMVHAGMITELAEQAAETGAVWPLLSPLVGVLGTFVSGSATASNILFSEFQVGTAAALSLPPVLMLAAQGFGAAAGNMIAPHNIIAGNATVGLSGREGDVLRATARICAVYVAAAGLAVLVLG